MLLSGFAVVGGILTFVVSQFIEGVPALVEQVGHSIEGVGNWLSSGPLHVSSEQIEQARKTALEALRNNQEKVTSGALSTAGTLTEIVTGALLVLFTLIFLLHGGRNIFAFVTKVFPDERAAARARRRAGRVPLADRLCARDVPGGAGRRGRYRHRPGHHGHTAGAAVGVAGVPRRVHPAGRCGDRRIPGRHRRADRQGLDLSR